jgi:hypothetical protein
VAEEIQTPDDLEKLSQGTSHPLDARSDWNKHFRNASWRAEVRKDVARTFQELDFFTQTATQDTMERILLAWAIKNPHIGYRQGMSNLAGIFMFALKLDYERVAVTPFECFALDANMWEVPEIPSLAYQCFLCLRAFNTLPLYSTFFCQADSYSLLDLMMVHVLEFYEDDSALNSTDAGSYAASSLLRRFRRIEVKILKALDFSLWKRFHAFEVSPALFLLRWVRLVFSGEFSVSQVLQLWDALFLDRLENQANCGFPLLDHFCVAMIVYLRVELMAVSQHEAFSIFQILSRYPKIRDVSLLLTLAKQLRLASNSDCVISVQLPDDQLSALPVFAIRSQSISRATPLKRLIIRPIRHTSSPQKSSLFAPVSLFSPSSALTVGHQPRIMEVCVGVAAPSNSVSPAEELLTPAAIPVQIQLPSILTNLDVDQASTMKSKQHKLIPFPPFIASPVVQAAPEPQAIRSSHLRRVESAPSLSNLTLSSLAMLEAPPPLLGTSLPVITAPVSVTPRANVDSASMTMLRSIESESPQHLSREASTLNVDFPSPSRSSTPISSLVDCDLTFTFETPEQSSNAPNVFTTSTSVNSLRKIASSPAISALVSPRRRSQAIAQDDRVIPIVLPHLCCVCRGSINPVVEQPVTSGPPPRGLQKCSVCLANQEKDQPRIMPRISSFSSVVNFFSGLFGTAQEVDSAQSSRASIVSDRPIPPTVDVSGNIVAESIPLPVVSETSVIEASIDDVSGASVIGGATPLTIDSNYFAGLPELQDAEVEVDETTRRGFTVRRDGYLFLQG